MGCRGSYLLFLKVLLLRQPRKGIFDFLSGLRRGQRVLRLLRARVQLPGAEAVPAGQRLHRQLHLGLALPENAGAGVAHGDGAGPSGIFPQSYVLQEGGTVAQTLLKRIQRLTKYFIFHL